MSTNTPNTNNKFALLKRVFALAKPYKAKLIAAILITLTIAILGPLRPYLVQYTIDAFIAKPNPNKLWLMCTFMLLLICFQSAIQVWSTILSNYLAQHVIKDLRLKVYDYLTKLKVRFYDKTAVGTLVTRTVNDIETVADVFSEGLINISGDVMQIIFILIFMFTLNWKLALVSLSVLPFLLYAGYLFKEKVRISFEEVRTLVAKLNTFVQEHIQGMQVVQVFNKQEAEFKKFESLNNAHKIANIKSVMYYSVFFPVVEIIAALSTALIIAYGAKAVLAQEASVGMLTSFIMYINLFFRPIRQLADRFNTMQMGLVASERIFKLMDENKDVETTGTKLLQPIVGHIRFKEVDFSYEPNQPVLNQISFEVKPGETLALVGATGAGKSSVIGLLTKFYEINSGNIYIDHVPLSELNLAHYRQQIALVLQDVFLFSGTVMDNIKLNNPTITDEMVMHTSKLLGAHHFIMQLPNGYNQQVFERGATLSVGQRQLISFVRAMVVNPAILILDEATSSVDSETENIIKNAIATMMAGRTSVVIAHRLSTIKNANQILVLNQGKIIEQGTHQTLLNLNGHYKKLSSIQFQQHELA